MDIRLRMRRYGPAPSKIVCSPSLLLLYYLGPETLLLVHSCFGRLT